MFKYFNLGSSLSSKTTEKRKKNNPNFNLHSNFDCESATTPLAKPPKEEKLHHFDQEDYLLQRLCENPNDDYLLEESIYGSSRRTWDNNVFSNTKSSNENLMQKSPKSAFSLQSDNFLFENLNKKIDKNIKTIQNNSCMIKNPQKVKNGLQKGKKDFLEFFSRKLFLTPPALIYSKEETRPFADFNIDLIKKDEDKNLNIEKNSSQIAKEEEMADIFDQIEDDSNSEAMADISPKDVFEGQIEPKSRIENRQKIKSAFGKWKKRNSNRLKLIKAKISDGIPFTPNPTERFFPFSATKRKQTTRACKNCVRAKAGCDRNRPCRRCIRLSKKVCIDREIVDTQRKKRIVKKEKEDKHRIENPNCRIDSNSDMIIAPETRNKTLGIKFRNFFMSKLNTFPWKQVLMDRSKVLSNNSSEGSENKVLSNGFYRTTNLPLDQRNVYFKKGFKTGFDIKNVVPPPPPVPNGIAKAFLCLLGSVEIAVKVTENLFGREETKSEHEKNGEKGRIDLLVRSVSNSKVETYFDINKRAQKLFDLSDIDLARTIATQVYSIVPEKEWTNFFELFVKVVFDKTSFFTSDYSFISRKGAEFRCRATLKKRKLLPGREGWGISVILEPQKVVL